MLIQDYKTRKLIKRKINPLAPARLVASGLVRVETKERLAGKALAMNLGECTSPLFPPSANEAACSGFETHRIYQPKENVGGLEKEHAVTRSK